MKAILHIETGSRMVVAGERREGIIMGSYLMGSVSVLQHEKCSMHVCNGLTTP